MTSIKTWALVAAVFLVACSTKPHATQSDGPVAAPQVAYRIDESRYFEVVPIENLACARARLYYRDTARKIHTDVASWDRVANGTLVVDAANDRYLIAPLILSSSNCQTGDSSSFKCASRLPFSVDAGRTWKYNIPQWSDHDVYMSGAQIYTGGAHASIAGLDDGYVVGIWTESLLQRFPQPAIPPLDRRPYCKQVGKDK